MDEPRRQRIARAEPVHDLHLVPRGLVRPSGRVAHGGEAVPPDEVGLAARADHRLDAELLHEPLGHLGEVVAGDAEEELGVGLACQEHVAHGQKRSHDGGGAVAAPELRAVVEVDARGHSGGARRAHGFVHHLGGARAERGRDAGDVEPLAPAKIAFQSNMPRAARAMAESLRS